MGFSFHLKNIIIQIIFQDNEWNCLIQKEILYKEKQEKIKLYLFMLATKKI